MESEDSARIFEITQRRVLEDCNLNVQAFRNLLIL